MTVTPSPPSGRPESALERLLKRIGQCDAFPSISKYLMDINRQLAADPEDSNASDLSNIILKDHALTGKLLKIVNSAFYGLAGGKVSTVTRAVVVLGYEKVRLATLNLALLEHFNAKSGSTHLKEALISAFWSGLMARELAAVEGGIDPEEAFVCAMMGQLGKLVVICYLDDDFDEITRRIVEEGMPEARAVRSVCGVSYEDLGVAVARQWNFPSRICESMQPASKAELPDKPSPPSRLRMITDLTRTLCGTVNAGRPPMDHAELERLLERYRPHLTVPPHQVKHLIADSLDNVHRHARALSLNTSQSDFLDRLVAGVRSHRRVSATAGAPGPQDASSFCLKNDAPLKTDGRMPGSRDPKDVIMEGIQEISQIMLTDGDMGTVTAAALEILYRAMDFQRALMFVQDRKDHKMSVGFGCGHDCQRLIGKLDFSLTPSKDLFNLSIQVGKDLIVADAHDVNIRHLIPAWYRQKIDARAFIFLPVMLQHVCIGALYADRDSAGTPVSETEHRCLGMLRNQVILSVRYRQSDQRQRRH
jgi:HD-like signal output (HDOD) protein